MGVLIVDDDRELSDALRTVLEGQGFEVEAAYDGSAALAACRKEAPDIVLLDYELPDVDGPELCRQLRTFIDSYIILLTGRSAEQDKVTSFTLGADDYVVKPFSYPELLMRMRSMLRRPRGLEQGLAPTHRRTIGPVTVDRSTREVWVGDEAVVLTKTEFSILSALFDRSGAVLERKDMLREVWGGEWSESGHMIEVHVHNLRRKLTAAGADPSFLVTIRGVGYRLVAN